MHRPWSVDHSLEIDSSSLTIGKLKMKVGAWDTSHNDFIEHLRERRSQHQGLLHHAIWKVSASAPYRGERPLTLVGQAFVILLHPCSRNTFRFTQPAERRSSSV